MLLTCYKRPQTKILNLQKELIDMTLAKPLINTATNIEVRVVAAYNLNTTLLLSRPI